MNTDKYPCISVPDTIVVDVYTSPAIEHRLIGLAEKQARFFASAVVASRAPIGLDEQVDWSHPKGSRR